MVEDDPATSNALRKILTLKGCDVRVAGTLADGRAHLESQPDAVILDLMLPDGDGETLLQAIRSAALPVRVVVTTGSIDAHRLKAVRRLGPELVLPKPVDPRQLLNALGLGD